MTAEPRVLKELEERLVATYYRKPPRAMLTRAPRLLAVIAVPLLVVAVIAFGFSSGGATPSEAVAALDSAASAVRSGSVEAMTSQSVWTARVIITSNTLIPAEARHRRPVKPIKPMPPPLVRIAVRDVVDVATRRNGTTTRVTRVSDAFVNPLNRSVYRLPVLHPEVSRTVSHGSGRLESPLSAEPVLTYRELRGLPTDPTSLARVVSNLARRAPAATSTTQAGSHFPTQVSTVRSGEHTIVTGPITTTVIGSCCKANADERFAVKQLGIIASLLTLPVRATVRSGLYHLAASLPGVRYSGTAQDALGRTGVAVTVGPADSQMTLIFDRHTGRVLGSTMTFGSAASAEGYGPLDETVQLTGMAASTGA
jgi:hypothetical protein